VHDCKRLAELSASRCKELWKALCYNIRKKDVRDISCKGVRIQKKGLKTHLS
jgi:hypothetical protein